MEAFNEEFYKGIKQAFKEAFLEAMFEYEQYKKAKRSKRDPDLISTNQAYKLYGEARVDELIERGLIVRQGSGRAKNSAKYMSRKRLEELKNTYL